MIFKVTDIFSWEVDDLIHLQVLMGGKNAEVARSTCFFTHTALAYQVQHFLDWVSS